MTLDELQAHAPHGSRWTIPVGDVRTLAVRQPGTLSEYTVVGWTDGAVIVLDGAHNTGQVPVEAMASRAVRHPDPPPCPITTAKTVTCYRGPHDWVTTISSQYPLPDQKHFKEIGRITLHPPGTFAVRPMPQQHGIYTWGDTP